MQITEITVSWNETCSLGNYSNVRPGLTLKATITPDEDVEAARSFLMDQARTYVQELVDQALEQDGKPAKYSTDPRYDICRATYSGHQYMLIVPWGTELEGHYIYRPHTKLRIAPIRRAVARYSGDGVTILEALDGDLTQLLEVLSQAKAKEEAEYSTGYTGQGAGYDTPADDEEYDGGDDEDDEE